MTCAIKQQAAFYSGYATDEHGLAPLTVLWATIVASWFLVYLIGCIVLPAKPQPVHSAAQCSSLAARP